MVFNLFLHDENCRTLVVVYAVNESGIDKSVDKSFLVCQMLVDYLCHVAVLLQIIDVTRHKRSVNICAHEFVQWVEALINTN